MRVTVKIGQVVLAGIGVAAMSFNSLAASINFDNQGLTGPSTFAAASPRPQHVEVTTGDDGNPLGGTVAFDNGVILTGTTALPADETSLYGTANFVDGLSNPASVSFVFGGPIHNFFLDVLNGEPFPVDYKVSDNNGNSATFTLPPNFSSGLTTIGFPALGTEVNVTALDGTGAPAQTFDFFVDNIHFNEELPPSLQVPDAGASALLLVLGLLGMRAIAPKMR